MKKIVFAFLSLELIALGAVRAQAPTGAIAGVVTEPAGAVDSQCSRHGHKQRDRSEAALATGARKHFSANGVWTVEVNP